MINGLIKDGVVEIGKYTYYDPSHIDIRYFNERNKVKIGNFTSIAAGVTMIMGGYHRVETISQYPFGSNWPSQIKLNGQFNSYCKGDIVIGSDCYVASNVMIMSGVTIGNGAVICAGSVVIKDVEPYTIYGGNPAKFIKYRFRADIIEKMLESEWWLLDDSIISELVRRDLFDSNKFEEFFDFIGSFK